MYCWETGYSSHDFHAESVLGPPDSHCFPGSNPTVYIIGTGWKLFGQVFFSSRKWWPGTKDSSHLNHFATTFWCEYTYLYIYIYIYIYIYTYFHFIFVVSTGLKVMQLLHRTMMTKHKVPRVFLGWATIEFFGIYIWINICQCIYIYNIIIYVSKYLNTDSLYVFIVEYSNIYIYMYKHNMYKWWRAISTYYI